MPEKPFIAGQAVTVQKKPEFLFGCHYSMMFWCR